MSRSTVYRVAERYRTAGEPGLLDRREENGDLKRDAAFHSQLYTIVHGSPLDYQWAGPTWASEMLTTTIHVNSMSRALHAEQSTHGTTQTDRWLSVARFRKNKLYPLHETGGDQTGDRGRPAAASCVPAALLFGSQSN